MLHRGGRPRFAGGVPVTETATTYEPEKGLTVTTYVHIEPGPEQRRDFARWCLNQEPRIETASASGSDVPLDLYPTIPAELLEGAYVDGYPYGQPQPQTNVPLTEIRLPVDGKPKPRKTAARRTRKAADN